MAKELFTTNTKNLIEIIGQRSKYVVPKYQRDYSWDKEEWEDLWEDLMLIYHSNEQLNHYMGYLVLQKIKDDEFYIIDGQQRLTTFSIIIVAMISAIRKMDSSDENKKRIEQIYSDYIGNINLTTMSATTKLSLNKNNNDYYRRYLSVERKPPKNLNVSCKRMFRCYEYFLDNISREFKNIDETLELLNVLNYRLLFTNMEVDDEINAYVVFETLNARGVELSTSDLLKNYLYSIVDKEEDSFLIDELDVIWDTICKTLGKVKFSDLLYSYWNGKYELKTKKDLFKALKKIILNKDDVFTLMRDLESKAENYVNIMDYNSGYWENGTDDRKYLKIIKLLDLKQPNSLLIHAIDILDTKDFEKLLKYVVNSSFRYNTICRKDPKEQSRIYNEFSRKMIDSGHFSFDEFRSSKVYISDEEFVSDFKYKDFSESSNDVAKYILTSIEKYNGTTSIDERALTIEHIMPKKYNANWGYDKDTIDNFANRLGNLILLEPNYNRECDQKKFKDKKQIYKKSVVKSTNELGNSLNDEWTADDINQRQNGLANQAKGIWKL